MSQAFQDMCEELADDPEKLAEFVKLYCGKSVNTNKKCLLCKDNWSDWYEDYKYNGFSYCSRKCEVLNNFWLNGNGDEFQKWLSSYSDKEPRMYHFTDWFDEDNSWHLLSKEKLKLLLESKEHIGSIMKVLSKNKECNAILKPYIALGTWCWIDNSNTTLLQKAIEIIGIQKLKETKKLNNIPKELQADVYKHLTLDDISYMSNNSSFFKHCIETYGLDALKAKEPYKYIYTKECFNIIYKFEEITDEMVWYYLKDYRICDWFFNEFHPTLCYILKNPKQLFQFLTHEGLVKATHDNNSMYMKAGQSAYTHHVACYSKIPVFINYQVKHLKPYSITLPEFRDFFERCKEFGSYTFSVWVNIILRNVFTPDELDWADKDKEVIRCLFRENAFQEAFSYIEWIIKKDIEVSTEYFMALCYAASYQDTRSPRPTAILKSLPAKKRDEVLSYFKANGREPNYTILQSILI